LLLSTSHDHNSREPIYLSNRCFDKDGSVYSIYANNLLVAAWEMVRTAACFSLRSTEMT